MKKIITLTIFIIFSIYSFTQAPSIQWQNTIGGSLNDYLDQVQPAIDGGYIISGYTLSGISYDKTEINLGSNDYWIVKLNNSGIIEWQNTIGANATDLAQSIIQTTDGGYIVGGNSNSYATDDKTENVLGICCVYDYWVLKLNSTGTIVWQNTIGSTETEDFESIVQSSDGGYLIGGDTNSPIGGDKVEANVGSIDYWLVKLNATGGIVWQNVIGGAFSDEIQTVQETIDGGYIVGGYSSSNISGDKTEPSIGLSDFWILKISSTGAIEWQNTIGTSGSDYLKTCKQTSDGGYFIGGYTTSGISADKTEMSQGNNDYWVLKLNSIGEIEWQNSIGGSGNDYLYDAIQTIDGGYLLAGKSNSNISGDKTSNTNGSYDYWLLKLNVFGEIIWQKDIGGNGEDNLYSINQSADGGYILGGYSESGISGDKSEVAHGGDYWVVKLFPDCVAVSETCNTLDDNCNGLIDDGVVETINISAGGATTFCQGGNVLLSATYSGASIQWKKNGSNIPGAISSTYSVNKSGNYSAVTTSPCGSATSTIINVTVNKNPNASISAGGATTFCAGGSVTLTETTVAGCTYQWYKGASLIAGATSTNYIATIAGNYKCRVTKTATGCYKNSNVISVTVPCKEGEENNLISDNQFTIYPNPNNGTFILSAQSAQSAGAHIQIYNSLGELIYSQQLNSPDNNFTETFTLENISSGIYFLRVGDGNNYAEQKLIIEK